MITKGNCYPAFSFKELEDFRLCILDLKNEINDLKKKVKNLEDNKLDSLSLPPEVGMLRTIGPGYIPGGFNNFLKGK